MLYTEFQAALITYLLAQVPLTNLVADRIYFADFSTLYNISYPAITLALADGSDFQGIVRSFPMSVYSHSELTYDEAHQVMDVSL